MTPTTSLISRICTFALLGSVAAVEISRKVGLAWGGGPQQVGQFEATGKVSWYYHWSEQPSLQHTDLEFVPMLWGARSVTAFATTIQSTITNYNVKVVLGMNEPDLGSQANLTPAEGAAMWQTYMQPLKAQGLRLASPVPTNAPTGPTWLSDMLTACGGGCSFDIIALHWYGTDADAMIQYITNVHNMFPNQPIWVTEFACQDFVNANNVCSMEDIQSFMNTTVSFMEEMDWIERYSWFGAMTALPGMNPLNALMDSSGHINALGSQYIGEGNFTDGGGFVPSLVPSAGHQSGVSLALLTTLLFGALLAI